MPADELLRLARSLVRAVPYMVLSTHDGHDVHSRQVQPLAVSDDLDMDIGTSPRSRKVDDILRTGRATVTAELFDHFAYASVSGAACIVDDETERRGAWIDDLAAFFPAGPGGDDFVVVRLRAERIELMDFSAGVAPMPYGLVPAVLVRTDDGWTEATADRRH